MNLGRQLLWIVTHFKLGAAPHAEEIKQNTMCKFVLILHLSVFKLSYYLPVIAESILQRSVCMFT